MNEKGLFRPEAVENRRNKNYGSVSINTPMHYTILSIGFSGLVGLILLFLLLGEFSEKFIVKGYLESTKGVARIFPNRSGVIAKCFVKQGNKVKKGEELFLIDTSFGELGKNKSLDVLSHLEKNKKNLEKEIKYKKAHLKLLNALLIKKYIPLVTYNNKQDEINRLDHQLNSVDIEIINYKRNKSYVIRSPIEGIVTSVTYQEGQYTNLTKPLMKILPYNADLLAELFIPVPQSGFLHRNNKVMIRYDAYPYAHFGASTARIHEISKSVLTDDEEEKPIRIGEPYYKITALLDKQYISIYGKNKKIQHGMTISAVIVGSKRKIWQWLLDPIYSFYGGVFV